MSGANDAALEHFARSSAEAVTGVLARLLRRGGRLGPCRSSSAASSRCAGCPSPGVAAEVAYVDGVTGGNVFCLGMRGARRLAAAMMGADPRPRSTTSRSTSSSSPPSPRPPTR